MRPSSRIIFDIDPGPEVSWDPVDATARLVRKALTALDLDAFLKTTGGSELHRDRKILIDYLRNNRTNASVAAFSTRAKPHAPVSVPIDRHDLARGIRSDRFTVLTLGASRLRKDPWTDCRRSRQRISAAAYRAIVGR